MTAEALDTSVCIPALLSWHEDHEASLEAMHHGTILLTRDRRASRTYDALGVHFRLVT